MSNAKIVIDGVEYIRADRADRGAEQAAASFAGMRYVLVRTYSAGVFAGYLESRNGQEVVMRQARRIWYWEGAASLSQLATDGTSKPENCKFPVAVDRVELLQAIEILGVSQKAQESIASVKIWKK